MPSYRVTSKRFFDGLLYGPGEPRTVLTVPEPFEKVPTGLILIEDTPKIQEKVEKKSTPFLDGDSQGPEEKSTPFLDGDSQGPETHVAVNTTKHKRKTQTPVVDL